MQVKRYRFLSTGTAGRITYVFPFMFNSMNVADSWRWRYTLLSISCQLFSTPTTSRLCLGQ